MAFGILLEGSGKGDDPSCPARVQVVSPTQGSQVMGWGCTCGWPCGGQALQQSTQRWREAVCCLVDLTMEGNRRPGSGWGSGTPIGTPS